MSKKISEERKNELEDIYQHFLNDTKIQRMKTIPMHRGSNCYLHSFKVAKLAIKHALNHKDVSLEVILIAAILHDYYLYDWRTDRSKLKNHGKDHPYIAAKNAVEDFNISSEIQKAIQTHMWPINIKAFPNTTEARIITVADKMVATREALTSKRHKAKRVDKYNAYISCLFDY